MTVPEDSAVTTPARWMARLDEAIDRSLMSGRLGRWAQHLGWAARTVGWQDAELASLPALRTKGLRWLALLHLVPVLDFGLTLGIFAYHADHVILEGLVAALVAAALWMSITRVLLSSSGFPLYVELGDPSEAPRFSLSAFWATLLFGATITPLQWVWVPASWLGSEDGAFAVQSALLARPVWVVGWFVVHLLFFAGPTWIRLRASRGWVALGRARHEEARQLTAEDHERTQDLVDDLLARQGHSRERREPPLWLPRVDPALRVRYGRGVLDPGLGTAHLRDMLGFSDPAPTEDAPAGSAEPASGHPPVAAPPPHASSPGPSRLAAGFVIDSCGRCGGLGSAFGVDCPDCEGAGKCERPVWATWDRNMKMWRCLHCASFGEWDRYFVGACPECAASE